MIYALTKCHSCQFSLLTLSGNKPGAKPKGDAEKLKPEGGEG
jgi:hypothetical protein